MDNSPDNTNEQITQLTLKDGPDYPANVLHKSRTEFKQGAYSWLNEEYRKIIIDQQFEEPYFGKMDNKGNAIFLDTSYLKQVIPTSNSIITINDFVRDSFRAMSQYYDNVRRQLPESSGPLSSLRVTKGFVDVNGQYVSYLNELNSELLQFSYSSKIKKIISFQDFVDNFIYFLTLKRKIFNRSSFILSNSADPFVGGLSLALATDDLNDDLNKFNSYIADKNFQVFVDACYKFGFTIDLSAPWIIHYNFNYGNFINFIQLYRAENYNSLIEQRYYKAYRSDIKILKDFLLSAYNVLFTNETLFYSLDSVNTCNIVVVKENSREPLTLESLEANFSDEYWLKLYFEIRLLEDGTKLLPTVYEDKVKNIVNLNRYVSYKRALDYLNSTVIKARPPLDRVKYSSY